MNKQELVKLLFASQALKISPEDKPFWYTSGTFGPYYLNTHFLFGGPTRANQFLAEIEQARNYPQAMPNRLFKSVQHELSVNSDFKALIEALAKLVEHLEFDCISGGERRDFYFSIPLANFLSLPHVMILKDSSAYISDCQYSWCKQLKPGDLASKKVLHVADLLTQASSYFRAWLPALDRCGAEFTDTAVIVSRLQGGEQALADEGIRVHSLLDLDQEFFDQACTAGLISDQNKQLVLSFQADPEVYMREFLQNHPDFLSQARAGNDKDRERAERFILSHGDLIL